MRLLGACAFALVAGVAGWPAHGQDAGAVLAAQPAAGYVSPLQPVDDYFAAIERIESEFGPYATELSDLYLGLGQSLLDTGDYEKARDAFHRGVMVMRVNSGPNSPEQTNHLFLIANIETLLGERKTADAILHNIQFINASYYGEDSPELLPVLERMYQWYQVARPLSSSRVKFSDFDIAIELREEMLELSEQVNGEDHPYTAQAYRRMGEAHFHAARFLTRDDPVITFARANQEGMITGDATHHFDEGGKAIRKYLELLLASDGVSGAEVSRALAEMGDWYLVLGRLTTARGLYRKAYEVLAQDESGRESAEHSLGRPQPVYFMQPLGRVPEGLTSDPELASLNVSMTVNGAGKPLYVEILDAPEEVPADVIEGIRREVLDTPFRPALREGKVVTTRDFIWQYWFLPGDTT